MKMPIIGFVGMTHLGLVSGVAAAKKGFQIVCFDKDQALIESIKEGKLPVSEPQIEDLIYEGRNDINFTSDEYQLAKCDVIYIAPDIPTNDSGNSDLEPIEKLIEFTYGVSREDAVIVVLSQVPPGFSRKWAISNRQYYYQVETLIFGRAIERALHPERYIVGCINPDQELPESYKKFLDAHNCPILKMRYESAELAKISINMCLVASVSTANTLAEICEKIGADWSEIIPSLKLDKRIGQYSYLNPGLGISGGNLERDLATVCRLGDEYGTDTGTVRAWIMNSKHRKNWPLRILHREVLAENKNPTIAILGLAYKENTHSIKNSPALLLLESLQTFKTRLYDPVVSAEKVAGNKIYFAKNALDACEGADAVVIMTPWDEFRSLEIERLSAVLSGNVVIDPYKLLAPNVCLESNLRHYTLGA
jgi:UDPglucose 6-dehydrogenase